MNYERDMEAYDAGKWYAPYGFNILKFLGNAIAAVVLAGAFVFMLFA